MESKRRIEWIDIVKFFCIYFVMLSHLGNNQLVTYLGCFFNPFYLTGFLFVSGYTFRFAEGFRNHALKKARQLLIPWLCFGLLCILSSHVLTFNPQNHQSLSVELFRFFIQVRCYGDEMWFLAALFVAYIPFYFLIRAYETRKKESCDAGRRFFIILLFLYFLSELYGEVMPEDLFPWGTNALPWHIEYIPFAVFFMFSGYMFRERCEESFDIANTAKNRMVALLIYLLLVYLPVIFNLDFWPAEIILKFISRCLGIAVLVSFCISIRPDRFMLYIGRNTLTCFGLHGKLIVVCEMVFRKLLPGVYQFVYNSEVFSIPYCLLMGFVLAALLVIPSVIINRFFPFMLGKWYKKSKVL